MRDGGLHALHARLLHSLGTHARIGVAHVHIRLGAVEGGCHLRVADGSGRLGLVGHELLAVTFELRARQLATCGHDLPVLAQCHLVHTRPGVVGDRCGPHNLDLGVDAGAIGLNGLAVCPNLGVVHAHLQLLAFQRGAVAGPFCGLGLDLGGPGLHLGLEQFQLELLQAGAADDGIDARAVDVRQGLQRLHAGAVDIDLGHVHLGQGLQRIHLGLVQVDGRHCALEPHLVQRDLRTPGLQLSAKGFDRDVVGLHGHAHDGLGVLQRLPVDLHQVAVIAEHGREHGLAQVHRGANRKLQVGLLHLGLLHDQLHIGPSQVVGGRLAGLGSRGKQRAWWQRVAPVCSVGPRRIAHTPVLAQMAILRPLDHRTLDIPAEPGAAGHQLGQAQLHRLHAGVVARAVPGQHGVELAVQHRHHRGAGPAPGGLQLHGKIRGRFGIEHGRSRIEYRQHDGGLVGCCPVLDLRLGDQGIDELVGRIGELVTGVDRGRGDGEVRQRGRRRRHRDGGHHRRGDRQPADVDGADVLELRRSAWSLGQLEVHAGKLGHGLQHRRLQWLVDRVQLRVGLQVADARDHVAHVAQRLLRVRQHLGRKAALVVNDFFYRCHGQILRVLFTTSASRSSMVSAPRPDSSRA